MSLSRVARFVEDHWRITLAPVGAILMSSGSILISAGQCVRGLGLFALGGLGTLFGVVLVHRLSRTNSQLRDVLAEKENEIVSTRNRRVFLLVAAFMEEWQVELEFHLLQELRRVGLSCTILVPEESYDFAAHQALQREALQDAKNYLGGLVIIPVWGDERVRALADFTQQLSKPVVFVDQNPPLTVEQIPSNVSYVSVNDSAGGELAAKAVLELTEAQNIRRVLVISGAAKQNRWKRFVAVLKEGLKDCEVVVSEDGKFDRATSETVAYNFLIFALKKNPFDVVFCTADSMTLGCLDAIARIDWRGCSRPRIIGYDGIAITQRLVASGKSPIARIVVQDAGEVARISVEQLTRLNQQKSPEKIVWVTPFLYPRQITRSRHVADISSQV